MTDVYKLIRHFNPDNSPVVMREVSERFQQLAENMMAETPKGEDQIKGLEKLLEARDWFCRAVVSIYGEQ